MLFTSCYTVYCVDMSEENQMSTMQEVQGRWFNNNNNNNALQYIY